MNKTLLLLTLMTLAACSSDDTNGPDGQDCLSNEGDVLSNYRVTSYEDGSLLYTMNLEDNGKRFRKIVNGNGDVLSEYTYDADGKLLRIFGVINHWTTGISGRYDYSFEYNGSQITKVNKWDASGQSISETLEYEYEGDTITAYDATYPTGLFKRRLVLDDEGKVIEIDSYLPNNNGTFTWIDERLIYDEAGRLDERDTEQYLYFVDTGNTINEFEGFDYLYAYDEDIINPMQQAGNAVYLNYWLGPEPFLNGVFNANFAANFSGEFPVFVGIRYNSQPSQGWGINFRDENLKFFCNQLPAESIYAFGENFIEFIYQ